MDTNDLSYLIERSRIKSARRKTRLQKKDKEKPHGESLKKQ